MLSSSFLPCELPDRVYDEVVYDEAHWNVLKNMHFALITKVGNNVGLIKNTLQMKNY